MKKKKPKTRGRRLMGKEKRVTTSVRIEPKIKGLIEKGYGSVQKFFDEKIKHELESAKEVTVETKEEQSEVSVDDF
jgi:hypothetical protein